MSLSACLVSQTADLAVSTAFSKTTRSNDWELSRDQRREGCFRLIEKLAASHQLGAGFLLRVLQQGQIDLFELGFAYLVGVERARMGQVLFEGGPRLLAIACRAAGIDRAAFPTVFSLSRRAHRMPHLLDAADRLDAIAVFEAYSRTEAQALLLAV